MPDNWIGNIKITNETEVLDSTGTKIHDYISCDQGAGVPVDQEVHPVLWGKLGGTEEDRDAVRCEHNYPMQQYPLGTATIYSVYPTYPPRLSCLAGASIIEEAGEQFARLPTDSGYHTAGGQGKIRTIECILRISTPSPYRGMFISFSLQSDKESYDYGTYRALYIQGTRLWAYYRLFGQPVGGTYVDTGVDIAIDEWTQFSFSWDSGNAFVHVNGILVSTLPGGYAGAESALYFALGTYYPSKWRGLACDIYGARGSTHTLYGAENYTPLPIPYAGLGADANVPDMPNATGSPWPYKIIADKT